MRNLLITLIIIFIISGPAPCQDSRESTNPGGVLSLRIKNIDFIKNNEYYNPIIEGYTMPGFFLQPELLYSPSGKVTVRGGIHLLKYAGTEKFSQIRPVISATWNISGTTALTV